MIIVPSLSLKHLRFNVFLHTPKASNLLKALIVLLTNILVFSKLLFQIHQIMKKLNVIQVHIKSFQAANN